jgi:hypothetical protein
LQLNSVRALMFLGTAASYRVLPHADPQCDVPRRINEQ